MWGMRIACWIHKATNTHLEYVILIAFPLQQCLHERALILHYMYIVFLIRYSHVVGSFCSDTHVAYEPLISHRIYPASTMNKY